MSSNRWSSRVRIVLLLCLGLSMAFSLVFFFLSTTKNDVAARGDSVNLFLISGGPLGDVGMQELRSFIHGHRTVGLITCGDKLNEMSAQEQFRSSLAPLLGVEFVYLSCSPSSLSILSGLHVLFVSGGNTPFLLQRLQSSGLAGAIQKRVRQGTLRYIGASAGSVVTGPNIGTTNDWRLHRDVPFDGLSLIPFCLNVHYFDTKLGFQEGRDDRIREFIHFNRHLSVLAMQEGSVAIVNSTTLRISGDAPSKLFKDDDDATATLFNPGSIISLL